MDFSEQEPSKQWAALKFRGQAIAEVWFKPEGEPNGLVFRIPASSFEVDGVAERLTIDILLKSVGIVSDKVDSWHYGSDTDSASGEENLELGSPLPKPADDANYLEVCVRLKPPQQTSTAEGNQEPAFDAAKWRDFEARWKTILGLEAAVDVIRKDIESLRVQLELAWKQNLTAEEKVHALAADLALWNKAKNRAHFTLPKATDFIRRATWAEGDPERKRLGEIFKNPIDNQSSLPPANEADQELEAVRKERQVMTQMGTAVAQECKSVLMEVQGCLRRLQVNAAIRASKKKGGTGAKGKSLWQN